MEVEDDMLLGEVVLGEVVVSVVVNEGALCIVNSGLAFPESPKTARRFQYARSL
jgi:hypothetical protein